MSNGDYALTLLDCLGLASLGLSLGTVHKPDTPCRLAAPCFINLLR